MAIYTPFQITKNQKHETYRLDGTTTGTSTPSVDPTDSPTTGNTVTISAPYQAIQWFWLRQTDQDDGTGSIAKVTINGFEYHAGVGTVYGTQGWTASTTLQAETIGNDLEFTASGNAHIEIQVIR